MLSWNLNNLLSSHLYICLKVLKGEVWLDQIRQGSRHPLLVVFKMHLVNCVDINELMSQAFLLRGQRHKQIIIRLIVIRWKQRKPKTTVINFIFWRFIVLLDFLFEFIFFFNIQDVLLNFSEVGGKWLHELSGAGDPDVEAAIAWDHHDREMCTTKCAHIGTAFFVKLYLLNLAEVHRRA